MSQTVKVTLPVRVEISETVQCGPDGESSVFRWSAYLGAIEFCPSDYELYDSYVQAAIAAKRAIKETAANFN